MKIRFLGILFIGILATSAFHSSDEKAEEIVTIRISKSYFEDFRNFQKEVSKLNDLVEITHPPDSIQLLQNQIITTRLAYKRIEYLFDYLQTNYNYLYINGPPLPKFTTESGDIIEPNGLQTLEELLFSEEAFEQLDYVKKLADELDNAVEFISKSHLYTRFSDRRIFEALRSGAVRVFTLGLTGFDTPGSGNAIPEALVSMQTMENAFLHFEDMLHPTVENKFLKIKKLFHDAQQFLEENNDFDGFDRMVFLKQFINPLYENLLDFQILNNIEIDQFNIHAQNYRSRNLFDENFLSTDYYSEFSFLPLNDTAIIKLGKMLFFDPILSKDIKMSCATCHDPQKAFTDGLPKSKASIPGQFTQRNSPTLIDAGYSSRFFWDMRDYNLERQVAHVVNNSLEFNIQFSEITERLKQSSEYVQMFNGIYSGVAKKTIYRRSISNAIAAYVNTLKSFDSEFDKYVRNEIDDYPADAIRGFNLFMGKAACGTCHFAPVFNGSVPPFYTDSESEVLGITLGLDTINPQIDPDPGRIENGLKREKLVHFKNSFKTVSVRNIQLTAPYMHNGLFTTLEDVMEFYDRGGGVGMGLEIENQTLSDAALNLSKSEKADIITFLNTLTDTTGLTNIDINLPKFENRPEWNSRTIQNY